MQVDSPRSLRSVVTLWDQSTTNQSVMLVLPDALQPKFYIADKFRRRNREAARAEREMERFKFLSRKLVTAERSNGRRGKRRSVSVGTNHLIRSKLERDVEERLLVPLRRDKAALKEFMTRVKRMKKSRLKGSLVKETSQNYSSVAEDGPVPKPACDLEYQESEESFMSADISCRTSVLSIHPDEADENSSVGPPPSIPKLVHQPSSNLYNKSVATSQWMKMIIIIQRHLKMQAALVEHRLKFQREQSQFMSALTIQRNWRRSGYAHNFSMVVKRFLYTQGRGHARAVFRARQDAANLLVKYLLTVESFKAIVKSFYSKVRHCQRLIRQHQVVSAARCKLLEKVFDRVASIIFLHAGPMLTGRSPRHLDVNAVEKIKNFNDPEVVRNLLTHDFYNYLLRLYSSNPTFASVLRTTRREHVNGKWCPDHEIKAGAIKQLLKKARHNYRVTMRYQFGKSLSVPLVSERDVRAYIHGGKDPLSFHIEKLDNVNKLPGKHLRRHIVPPPLLVLNSLSSEDILHSVVDVMIKEYNAKKERIRAAVEENNKQRMLEEFMAGARKRSPRSMGINRTVSSITGTDSTRMTSPTSPRGFHRSITMDSDPVEQNRVRESIVHPKRKNSPEIVRPTPPPLMEKPSTRPPRTQRSIITDF